MCPHMPQPSVEQRATSPGLGRPLDTHLWGSRSRRDRGARCRWRPSQGSSSRQGRGHRRPDRSGCCRSQRGRAGGGQCPCGRSGLWDRDPPAPSGLGRGRGRLKAAGPAQPRAPEPVAVCVVPLGPNVGLGWGLKLRVLEEIAPTADAPPAPRRSERVCSTRNSAPLRSAGGSSDPASRRGASAPPSARAPGSPHRSVKDTLCDGSPAGSAARGPSCRAAPWLDLSPALGGDHGHPHTSRGRPCPVGAGPPRPPCQPGQLPPPRKALALVPAGGAGHTQLVSGAPGQVSRAHWPPSWSPWSSLCIRAVRSLDRGDLTWGD